MSTRPLPSRAAAGLPAFGVVFTAAGAGLVGGPSAAQATPRQSAYDIATVDVNNNPNNAQQLNVEGTYLPKVVENEDGAGPLQALMAQAIAARSFLYYSLNTSGFIGDGQNAQVYTNPNLGPPDAQQIEAVDLTDRMILRYGNGTNDVTIAAFYAAGQLPTTSDSPLGVPSAGDGGNTATEPDITFNRGLVSNNITQTPQGFVSSPPDSFPLNRGSMSQNGANFLANRGWDFLDILRYYYGADIHVEIAGIPTNGSVPAPISIEGFNVDQGQFGNGVVSANNKNIVTATKSFVTSGTLPGSSGAQQIAVTTNASPNNAFQFYDIAGLGPNSITQLNGTTPGQGVAGTPSTNISMQAIGSIGFWLKATSASGSPDLATSILLNDDNGSETGISESVAADGLWHEYTWLLNDSADWIGFNTPNDSIYFSINSIELTGMANATFTLDDVVYNAAVAVPEPTVLCGVGLTVAMAALPRRRAVR